MIKKKEATTKQNESRLTEKPLISDCMWYFKCKAKPRRNAYFFQVPFSLVSHCIGSGIWEQRVWDAQFTTVRDRTKWFLWCYGPWGWREKAGGD